MTPNPEFEKAMNKTKIALMQRADSAFFASIAFSFRHMGDDKVPTACTNGKWVKYNIKWFLSMDMEERLFLMIHEVMHPAYMHLLRRGTRDPGVWNMACDYVINGMLVERGFKMPVSIPGLHDPQYVGMGAEAVYDLLMKNAKKIPSNMMLDLQPDGDTESEGSKDAERQMQDILVRAAMRSRQEGDKPGTVPGDIEIMLDKLLNPKLPWNVILRKFLNGFSKNDYSWRKPNRRFFPQYYIPSLYSESLETLGVAIDTSGSVSQEDFTAMVTEIGSIFRMMMPKQIDLVQFDTSIKSVSPVRSFNELLKVPFKGRGGTDITEAIEWANKTRPQVLLMLTDGYFDWPDVKPTVPVIWIIHNNKEFVAPYGKVIHYELNT